MNMDERKIMDNENTVFPFGVSYCPYAKSEDLPMEYWEDDIKNMKDLGFTIFRGFAAWDRMERKEGVIDFSKLDHAIELAEKHGLKFLLNVGGLFGNLCGLYPPRWVLRQYHCQEIITDPFHPETHFSPVRWVCMDDPVYREKADIFIAKVIERYAKNETLAAWSLWNEPFLRDLCYCRHSLDAFRGWLQRRYENNLAHLNQQWGTEFPVDYVSWDEIEPPTGAGFTSGGYAARIDWLQFNEDKLIAAVGNVHQLVRAGDPLNRPTTINIDQFQATDNYHGEHKCCDIWKAGRVLDILGYSFYTMSGEEQPYERAARLDRIRSASREKKHAFWIIETEAGPVQWEGCASNAEAPGRELVHWQAIAHGARSLLGWKYRGRVSDNQTDEFNMVGWDGSITERALLQKNISGKILQHARTILGMSQAPEVAILTSSDSMVFMEVNGKKGRWLDSWLGAYRLLWDLGIPADFVDGQDIREDTLGKYKALLMPYCLNLDGDIALAVEKFANDGGLVIADLGVGQFDNRGSINLTAPGFGLHRVFGCRFNDITVPAPDETMLLQNEFAPGSIPVHRLRHELHPNDKTVITGRFPGNKAAITANSYGKGRAVLFGTLFFAAYRKDANRRSAEITSALLADVGVTCAVKTSGDAKNIEVRTWQANNGSPVYFILNHSPDPIQVELGATVSHGQLQGRYLDLISNTSYTADSGRLQIPLQPLTAMMLVQDNGE